MIYLVISVDSRYADKPVLRMFGGNKLRNFYLVTYFTTAEEAADFCRIGGKFEGTRENRFWYYKLARQS